MGVEYRLDCYKADYTAISQLVGIADEGFYSLSLTKWVNRIGLMTFIIRGDHSLVDDLDNRAIIECWRRDASVGIDWTLEFTGLFLRQRRTYKETGRFEVKCVSPLWLLSTRHILYYANVADKTAFTSDPAETIMKTLVDYNAGPNATVGNGRMRTPGTLNITIQADGANGNSKDWYCAWDNLLVSLQDLVQAGAGGDFDLVRTTGANWQFRWYTGQLGADRTATVLFSLGFGNMANPEYVHDRIGEATVALVAGQGQEEDRATVVRTGPDYSASNDVEIFVQGTSAATAAGLNSIGDAALEKRRAVGEFDFDVVQSGSVRYGRDYFLGDKVKARYQTIEVTRKILGVQIKYDKDESVKVELGAL